MSSTRSRSDSASEAASNIEEKSGKPRSCAATLRDSNIEIVTEVIEPHSPTPGGEPRLKEVRRGVLNVSEASVPLPQSSPVIAVGTFFGPQSDKHSHTAKQKGPPTQGDSGEASQPVVQPEDLEQTSEHSSAATSQYRSEENHPGLAEGESLQVALSLVHQEDHTSFEQLEQLSPIPTPSVPIIEIHRPSDADSTMAALTSGVTNVITGSMPAKPVSSAVNSAAPVATSAIASPALLPITPPLSTSKPLGAVPTGLPIEVPEIALPAIPPVALPGLPLVAKVKKREKIVGKARRILLRKRVLSILLGKELAGTVHPLLNAAGDVTAPIDLPD